MIDLVIATLVIVALGAIGLKRHDIRQ